MVLCLPCALVAGCRDIPRVVVDHVGKSPRCARDRWPLELSRTYCQCLAGVAASLEIDNDLRKLTAVERGASGMANPPRSADLPEIFDNLPRAPRAKDRFGFDAV